jgi:hypothetical protein
VSDTEDLLPWLRAQIAETEELARGAITREGRDEWEMEVDPRGSSWWRDPWDPCVIGGGKPVAQCDEQYGGRPVALHIARNDPRTVLAQCEAHTALLFWHERIWVEPGSKYFNDAHLTREPMAICRSCEPETMFRRAKSWPCRTIKALALCYQHSPGYQEAWHL